MNLKEHLSEETLELFFNHEMVEEKQRAVKLHFSYCLICRQKIDDISLKRAIHHMWDFHEQSHLPDSPHIEAAVFARFWKGELRDEKLIQQISHHCVACRDCRQQRESTRVSLQNSQSLRRQILTTLALAAVEIMRKRRRMFVVAATASFFGLIACFVFWNWQTTSSPPSNKAWNNDRIAASPSPLLNGDPSQITPIQARSAHSSLKKRKPSRMVAKRQDAAHSDLIGQINLTEEEDGFRSSGGEEAAKSPYCIGVSRIGTTSLLIKLPRRSKKGTYTVSIRDNAYLSELVTAQGTSLRGENLPVSMNLQHLKAGDYVLRITRTNSQTDTIEYIGDYYLRVSERAVMSNPTSHKSARPKQQKVTTQAEMHP